MLDREALRAIATALPAGTAVPVPVEWLRELLAEGSGATPTAPVCPDPTVVDLAVRFGRSVSTVRWWIECGRFPGAYRFRGREWRVPPAAVAAFEAGERAGNGGPPTTRGPDSAGAVVDLGAWRKVG